MDIVLWRHCHAIDGVPDAARPLSPRGVNDAVRVARWLAPRLPEACRVVVSPALRAQQTAQALARPFETVAALGTRADVESVLAVVRALQAAAVLLVGHQPTLGCVASWLLDGDAHDRLMRAGEVLWLATDDAEVRSGAALTASFAGDSN